MKSRVAVLLAAAVVAGADERAGVTWRGLVVAAEDRCSKYDRSDCGSTAAEERIANNVGGWWSPYDGSEFLNRESERGAYRRLGGGPLLWAMRGRRRDSPPLQPRPG